MFLICVADLMLSSLPFQYQLLATLVMLLLLMEGVQWKEGWRCVEMEYGEQFMVNGISAMPESYVGN